MIGPIPLSVCVSALIEFSVPSGVLAAAAASVCSSQTAKSFAPINQNKQTNNGERLLREYNVYILNETYNTFYLGAFVTKYINRLISCIWRRF